MKGIAPILGILAVLAVIAMAAVTVPGLLRPAVVVPDASCQPGEIIKPLYGTYECRVEEVSTLKRTIPTWVSCLQGPCATVTCNYVDLPVGEPCIFKTTAVLYGTNDRQVSIPNGQTKTIILSVMLPNVPNGEIWYRGLYLQYKDPYNYLRNIKGGCDLRKTIIGEDVYSKIPKENRDRRLKQYDVVTTIVGYGAYPYAGNYVKVGGVDYVCRNDGITRSLYSLAKAESLSGCYWYEDKYFKIVECCPGDRRADGATCTGAPGFTWTVAPEETECCSGGLCSDIKCPGSGSWDWDGWSIGSKVKFYGCNKNTGSCDVVLEKAAQCNPFTNLGCAMNQRCDSVTLTCRDTPQPMATCTEAGYQCCLQGMFPFVSNIRTCEQAGKPNYQCINGFCYAPRPVDDCNFNGVCEPELGESKDVCPEDCATCDWLCQISKQLGLLFAGLLVSGIILMVLVAVSFFVPFLHPLFIMLTRNWKLLAVAWFGLGILLMVAFAPIVGQVYVMYLANIV